MIERPTALAELLIAHGADVNIYGSKRQTPLMVAAAFKDTEKLSLLLAHGANLKALDDKKATALFYTATDHYGSATVLEIVNSSNSGLKLADTPYSLSGQDKIEATDFLLAHGADINAKDKDGKTVLAYARAEHHPKLVAELEKADATE